jgi:hypothetical protein
MTAEGPCGGRRVARSLPLKRIIGRIEPVEILWMNRACPVDDLTT